MTGEIMEPPMMHSVRVTYTHPDGRVKLEAVPPEEFIISREAKSIETADYCAHRRILTVSELVAMATTSMSCRKMSSAHEDMLTNIERHTRNPHLQNEMNERDDPAMKKVMYMKITSRLITTEMA